MVGNVTLQRHCPEQSPQCYQPKHREEKVKGKKGLWCYSLQFLYLSARYLQIGYAMFLVVAEKGYFIFQEPFALQKPAYSL